eukprot:g3419.t1
MRMQEKLETMKKKMVKIKLQNEDLLNLMHTSEEKHERMHEKKVIVVEQKLQEVEKEKLSLKLRNDELLLQLRSHESKRINVTALQKKLDDSENQNLNMKLRHDEFVKKMLADEKVHIENLMILQKKLDKSEKEKLKVKLESAEMVNKIHVDEKMNEEMHEEKMIALKEKLNNAELEKLRIKEENEELLNKIHAVNDEYGLKLMKMKQKVSETSKLLLEEKETSRMNNAKMVEALANLKKLEKRRFAHQRNKRRRSIRKMLSVVRHQLSLQKMNAWRLWKAFVQHEKDIVQKETMDELTTMCAVLTNLSAKKKSRKRFELQRREQFFIRKRQMVHSRTIFTHWRTFALRHAKQSLRRRSILESAFSKIRWTHTRSMHLSLHMWKIYSRMETERKRIEQRSERLRVANLLRSGAVGAKQLECKQRELIRNMFSMIQHHFTLRIMHAWSKWKDFIQREKVVLQQETITELQTICADLSAKKKTRKLSELNRRERWFIKKRRLSQCQHVFMSWRMFTLLHAKRKLSRKFSKEKKSYQRKVDALLHKCDELVETRGKLEAIVRNTSPLWKKNKDRSPMQREEETISMNKTHLRANRKEEISNRTDPSSPLLNCKTTGNEETLIEEISNRTDPSSPLLHCKTTGNEETLIEEKAILEETVVRVSRKEELLHFRNPPSSSLNGKEAGREDTIISDKNYPPLRQRKKKKGDRRFTYLRNEVQQRRKDIKKLPQEKKNLIYKALPIKGISPIKHERSGDWSLAHVLEGIEVSKKNSYLLGEKATTRFVVGLLLLQPLIDRKQRTALIKKWRKLKMLWLVNNVIKEKKEVAEAEGLPIISLQEGWAVSYFQSRLRHENAEGIHLKY